MLNKTGLTAILTLALLTAGCLRKETTHTLYLSPGGAVSWVALERDVYSDESDPAKRRAEEQAYRGAVLSGSHAVAQGLTALAPQADVRTRVIRVDRPFQVVTEARYASIDGVMQRLFDESGIRATVQRTTDGARTTLRIALDFTVEPVDRESPVTALLEDFEAFRFVLTDGKFVAAAGFDLRGDAEAVPSKQWLEQVEAACETHAMLELSLSWETVPGR